MSVWLVLPSARPAAEAEACFAKWAAQGYRVAVQRDPGAIFDSNAVDIMLERTYRGYPESVNYLAKLVLQDPAVDWVVCAGDDTICDLNHTADEIAEQLTAFFDGTMGVCQMTGDRWADSMGVIIERIAGSPWMGREWCLRANQGRGPLWPEYFHNWADEELQLVATKLGCFWQRPDIIHYHEHAMRKPGGKWQSHQSGFSADYRKHEPLFRQRKAAGFPGSEPL